MSKQAILNKRAIFRFLKAIVIIIFGAALIQSEGLVSGNSENKPTAEIGNLNNSSVIEKSVTESFERTASNIALPVPIEQNKSFSTEMNLRRQQDVKDAIIREITDYVNQYQDNCFGKAVKLGDPAKFKAAIDKSMNRFYVGAEGQKRIKELSPNAEAFHHTYRLIGLTADLVFPFDPRSIPAGVSGYKNRQTMMHEMTHHIEWLNGVKESSKTVLKYENPRSERNTNYQDNVVNNLKQLVQIEKNLADNKSTIAEELTRYRLVETNLHDLERGSSAGGTPPDMNLETMTGFNARYDLIENHYLSGACGPKLRNLVLLYKLLWRINQTMDIEPITIKLGEEVTAEAALEDIDANKLDVPAELKPVFIWELPGGGTSNENPLKFTPDKEGSYTLPVKLNVTFEKETLTIATGDLFVTVEPGETKPKPSPSPSPSPSTINIGKGKFSGSVFGNWEGGNTPKGFVLKRKDAQIKGPCGWNSGVTASLKAEFVGFTQKPKDAAEAMTMADALFKLRRQGNTPNDMAVGLFMGGGTEGASSFSMGDYAGAIADFALWIRRGSGGFMGYTGSYMGSNGAGHVVKNGGVIAFSYQVNGGGCWDNSDRAYLVSQAVAAQEEARAILASLSLDDKGLIAPKPYAGPKYDGSDLPKVSLSPAKLKKLRVGETASIEAVVENAKAEDSPLTYNWSGTFDGKAEELKKSSIVQIKPTKPGKYTLSVGVDGARFGMGGASLEYEVADYKAEIKQIAPTAPKVILGVPISFSAQLLSDGKPISGDYVYRWQPHPEAKFEPFEGAGKETKAVFSRPGRTKVWVQILEKKGETLETVAESAQIEIEIVSPTLKLVFSPAAVNVGKEVKARVEVTPADLKDIDFRWELSANGKQTLVSTDTREITFIPQDTNPVSVTVRARVPFYGDDLGTQTATIAATVSQADLDKASSAAKLTEAKAIIRKGQLDEAAVMLDEAARLDPKNAEAAALLTKTRGEITTIKTQLEKCRILAQESKFPEAQRELIVAQNINSYYKPVADAMVEFGDSWRKYEAAVKEKLGAMQVANENRQFRKTLDIANQTRAELKLYDYNLETFNRFETWAQTHEAEKERQRAILKRGEEKYRNYDFAGAYEDLYVLFVKGDFYEYWNSNYDTEPPYYQKLKDDAFLKNKRINELLPNIRNVAADERFGAQIVEKAIADCDEILKIQPPNAEARNLRDKLAERLKTGTNSAKASEAVKRGEALHTDKKYDQAIAEFDAAIKLDPSNTEAYRLRGRSKREKGDLQGALRDFNKALEIEPNSSRTFLGRGLTYEKLGDSKSAISDYTRGIQLEPNYPNGYSYRGHLKIDLKDFKGAISDYDSLISLEPNNRNAYLNRGYVKAQLGDYKNAIGDYDRAIQIDANYSLAYNNRGSAKEKLGDLAGALADYEKAVQLDSSSELANNNLAKLKAKLAAGQTTVQPPTITGASRFYTVDLTPAGGKKGSPRVAKQIEIDDVSWLRLKSTDENRRQIDISLSAPVSSSAVAIVTNLDDATYLEQGRTIALMTIFTDAGKEVFEIKAGVHSSEWNYRAVNPKHQWVESLHIGDNRFLSIFNLSRPMQVRGIRFDYVETNSPLWVGHAPGFVLRGVTLISSGSTTTVTTIPPTTAETEAANVGNIYGVNNSPTAPTQFTVRSSYMLTYIQTYHWNSGRGAQPGTIAIRKDDGTIFGPWRVSTKPGQGGVPNAYWEVTPNMVIPAGTYTIVDSDPATWAQNAQSGGKGFAIVKGYAISGTPPTTTPTTVPPTTTPPTTTERMRISVTYLNTSQQNIHIFATGENFSPENRLTPGGRRVATGEGPKFTKITVYAGANGKVFDSLTFSVVPNGKYTVTFGSNNKLTYKAQ